MNQPRFAGRTVVVTGGASGIGKATVRRFLDEGANVVAGDLNEANGLAMLEAWHADADRLRFLAGNVALEDDIVALVNL
ncbi:MAG: SDR family NAD(P)-dependent oxidoreductase, partial [Actinobacteria bacterium]|nr:SDR family NAD(P)-dependent oxidoreductase [Actinomycetota bacterium]